MLTKNTVGINIIHASFLSSLLLCFRNNRLNPMTNSLPLSKEAIFWRSKTFWAPWAQDLQVRNSHRQPWSGTLKGHNFYWLHSHSIGTSRGTDPELGDLPATWWTFHPPAWLLRCYQGLTIPNEPYGCLVLSVFLSHLVLSAMLMASKLGIPLN